MRLGFFGGCFNPPTNAHINLAKKALNKCKLDKIIFVPMGDSYPKKELAKAQDRLSMLKIACKEIDKFEVSDLEIKENKKLNAISAFRLIEENYKNDNNFFLMGADNFIKMLNWEESNKLIFKYNYIIFEREDIDLEEYIKANEIINANKSKIIIIKNDNHKFSSATQFRKLLKEQSDNLEDIISKEVLEFILKNNIY